MEFVRLVVDSLHGFVLKLGAFYAVSHSYASAAVDWTLSYTENLATCIKVTLAGGAVNAIATPTNGKVFIIYNNSGQALTFKASGQTGVSISNASIVVVQGNGTDFVAVTTTSTSVSGATIENSIIGATTPVAATFTTLGYGALLSKTHDYAAGHADWTLSAAEGRGRVFTTTNAAVGGANAILPAGFVGIFAVSNTSGQTVTWKYAASTGIANATAKKQILFADGVEVYSLKADY